MLGLSDLGEFRGFRWLKVYTLAVGGHFLALRSGSPTDLKQAWSMIWDFPKIGGTLFWGGSL